MVLTTDGDLWAWGFNLYGTLGVGHKGNLSTPELILSKVKEVAGGGLHVLALCEDGSLWSWGQSNEGQLGLDKEQREEDTTRPVRVRAVPKEKIIGIGCGNYTSWAITGIGELYVWGEKCGIEGADNLYVPTKHNFLVKKPRPRTEQLWREIFGWWFLGREDRDSAFSVLPIEVVFHLVGNDF
jgi:alpha-tubulin suppressor-like RCC1 family protein